MNKISALKKLQIFCSKQKISVEDLKSLVDTLFFLEAEQNFEICYEDGTIAKKINLAKKPVAIKLFSQNNKFQFWVSLKCSYPEQFKLKSVKKFFADIPLINSQAWRVPNIYEMDAIIMSLSSIEAIYRCYDKQFSFPDEKYDINFGCYDNEGKLQVAYLYFPKCWTTRDDDDLVKEKLFWWPVCSAD